MQHNSYQHNLLLHIKQVFSSAHTDDGASGVHLEGRSAGQLSIRDGEEERQRQEGRRADRPTALTGRQRTGDTMRQDISGLDWRM
jgi:hypothetical protein